MLPGGGQVSTLKEKAQQVKKAGAKGGDTDLVFVNELEKKLLKAHGGSGKKDPKTGLRSYKQDKDSENSGSRSIDNDGGGDPGDQTGGRDDKEAAHETMGRSIGGTALDGGIGPSSQFDVDREDSGTGFVNDTSGAYGDLSRTQVRASAGERIMAGFGALFGSLGTYTGLASGTPTGMISAIKTAPTVARNTRLAASGMKDSATYSGETGSIFDQGVPTVTDNQSRIGGDRARASTVAKSGFDFTNQGKTPTVFDLFTSVPRTVSDWESLYLNRKG